MRYTIYDKLHKALLFIYPQALSSSENKFNLILGDDLLIMTQEMFSRDLLCIDRAQLVWVLSRQNYFLKKELVQFWLEEGDIDVLGEVFEKDDTAGMVLVDILLSDSEYEDNKLVELIENLQNPFISTVLCKLLPVSCTKPKIVSKILAIDLKLDKDEDIDTVLNFSKFLTAFLTFVVAEKDFKNICRLSKRTVEEFKEDKEVVDVFSGDSFFIRLLLEKSKDAEDETVTEILEFLRILLIIQQQYRSNAEEMVEINMNHLFEQEHHAEQCLEILHRILSSPHGFLKLDETSDIKTLFLNVFNTSGVTYLAKKSFYCLTKMMRMDPSLADRATTQIFIIYNCDVGVDEDASYEFIEFIGVWITSMKKIADKKRICIKLQSVENYVLRTKSKNRKEVFLMLKSWN